MNKHILKYLAFYAVAILLNSCNDSESELLEPKVYFENKEYALEIPDNQESMTYDLQARVSSMCSSSVDVSYEIADASLVEAYNKRFGTAYEAFDASSAGLSAEVTTVPGGEIYTEKTTLQFSNLENVKEGKPALLPVRIKSASLPVSDGADVVYFIITRPVRIMKAGNFNYTHVKIPLPLNSPFRSVTYEALIYINRLGNNNTIMGCEGVLVLRIGDEALPDGHNDWLQIAGSKQFHSTQAFGTGKWYHVAYTYDYSSGQTALYINGNKMVESNWGTATFDMATAAGGFFIGRIAGFMWGERPFNGYMSEVRLWNVARTENQLKQNMLMVDPTTEGLAAYYKLNGTDQYQKDSKWYIKDASGHLDGVCNLSSYGTTSAISFKDLDTPIVIK
ncbi:MAG: DUF1735 and LamG domain-containing protein [Bacteroides xylanisolvens]